MQYTQQPMKVEDFLGRKHVRGVFVDQSLFEMDMLNRVLVQLFLQRPVKASSHLMDDWLQKAQENPSGRNCRPLLLDDKTQEAYEACCAGSNTIAAASLLRVARMEQVFLHLFSVNFCRDMHDEAMKISQSHIADNFTVAMHVNGKPVEGGRRIFELSGEEVLAEKPDAYWYDAEYLNLPYVIENGLTLVGQVIIAKSCAVKRLKELLEFKILKDGHMEYGDQMMGQVENLRHAYLRWQISSAFIRLSGYRNAQSGDMTKSEARDYHRKKVLHRTAGAV